MVNKEKLEAFYKDNYKPQHGSFTEWRSEGNSSDVFDDGYNRGYAEALSEVAAIIGLDVPELKDPDFPDNYY
jgi:hypothetical protein